MKIVIISQYTLPDVLTKDYSSLSHICFVPKLICIHTEPEVEEMTTVNKHSDSTQTLENPLESNLLFSTIHQL